jgi:polar amino acid transport system permease protein
MAEIVRGGISSVDQGQSEAAASIGMSRAKTMLHIVLPQAVRAIIPPTGNELISMLKSTSLVSVIAARELLTSAQQIYAANFLTIELLLVASVWYLVLTTVASIGQGFIEYRFDVSLRTRKVPLLLRLWRRLRADRSKGGAL